MKPNDGLQSLPRAANGGATSAAQSADPLIGSTIGQKYKVYGSIARGGMGKVYCAHQMPLGRSVALKTLSLRDVGDAGDTSFHRRFELEAAACSELTHPNTVRVFDYGFDGDLCYLVMELVAGISLQRMVREQGPMSAQRVMHIGRQLCGSLGEAHGLGIVHRDLKPSNVMICDQGDEPDFVKLVDFGIAKTHMDGDLTKVGQIIGSPHYMAPEQIRGKDVDGRADVYSLGVCLFFALTGRRPFEDRESPIAVMMAQLSDEAPTQANTLVDIPESLN